MFSCLRLDRLIGRDHQHNQIDARRASQHVFHKALVTRNIDETKVNAVFFEEGEPEIDGDAASLFFFEAIGVGASESFDERRLAVIDMTGRADDNALAQGLHGE